MATWSLILFAATCFGCTFLLAHFTERFLFFIVGRRSHDNRESSRSAAANAQELANSDGCPVSPDASEQMSAGIPEAKSAARRDEPTSQPIAQGPQTRVRHRNPTALARRSLRRSAQAAVHLHAQPTTEVLTTTIQSGVEDLPAPAARAL